LIVKDGKKKYQQIIVDESGIQEQRENGSKQQESGEMEKEKNEEINAESVKGSKIIEITDTEKSRKKEKSWI